MIEWIGHWLREVVLMVLLAAFADLLLPKSTLQRYVKTVLGLFILMTLLTPIFTLLQKQKDINGLLAELDGAFGSSYAWTGGEAIPAAASAAPQAPPESRRGNGTLGSLAQILEDGERLKRANAEEAKRLVEAEIASLVNRELEGEHVRTSSVRTDFVDNNGEAQLRRVRVLLHAIDAPAEKTSPGRRRWGFEPVAPVQVRVDQVELTAPGGGEDAEVGNAARANSPEPPANPAVERVRRLLAERLQLSPDQITVEYAAQNES